MWDTTATNPLLRLEAYTRENLDEKKALPQVHQHLLTQGTVQRQKRRRKKNVQSIKKQQKKNKKESMQY